MMSSPIPPASPIQPITSRGSSLSMPEWLPLLLGVLGLYGPSLYDLFNGLWGSSEQAHGPIVLGISIWLIYRKWPEMMQASEGEKPSRLGWAVFVFALLLFAVGRSQDVLIFEMGSVIWLLIGLILLVRGKRALKAMWFPLFFLIFMVPLPGQIVDMLTHPMKMAVSYVAENVLYAAGYPISRSGVILQVGQYQLLVADACAGLHTLFTLEALGLLYLSLVRRDSLVRNVALAILVVPISFTANVIRVMILTLITYYFGDAAGQGFLHGFAGLVLFMSALLLIIGVDSLIHYGTGLQAERGEARQ